MKKINVATGFGYIVDAGGKVVSKAFLPAGEHRIDDGYEYREVVNQAALDAIAIATSEKTAEQKDADLIAETLQAMALAEIAKKGKVLESEVMQQKSNEVLNVGA
ncbi:MAG: hypothetical protein ABFD91_18990 [Anaerohalosphaeraceae bacterium]